MIPPWEGDARACDALVPVLAVALRRRAGPGARARARPAFARCRRPDHRPVRRPATGAGHHHGRAEHTRAEQRLGRTGRGRAGGRAAHDGSAAHVRARRRAPARAVLARRQPRRARRHRDPRGRHLPFRARGTESVVPDAAVAAPAVAPPDHVGDRGLRPGGAPGRAHVRYRVRDRPERRGSRSVREG